LQFFLGLFNARHVVEHDASFGFHHEASLGFAKVHGLTRPTRHIARAAEEEEQPAN
jgi:hypothetical protein